MEYLWSILSKEYKYLYIQSSQSKKCNKEVVQSSNIIQSVINRLKKDDYGLQSEYIDCFTTLHSYNPKNNKKDMYRADPYFYKRPWMDWCSSQWNLANESDNNDLIQEFPCRIFMFIDTRNMTFDKDITEKGRYLAIVKSSEIDKRSDRLRRNKD